MSNLIPVFRPSYGDKEIQAVTEVMKSGWVGLGPKTAEFEKKFAEYVGTKYAVGLNSATAALDLALKAHDIKDGEVILPALTFVSTGLAALYNNCKVVFADIDEETLCIDWEDVGEKMTLKTQAVIPVHYAGKNAETHQMNGIIIEDCAHATGNKLVGQNTSCWSFHAVKNLATGDGGMVTTNNEEVYQKLLPLRWCGIDKSTWERSQKKYGWMYDIQTIGYKCHMNDITASIGLAQLERIEDLNNKRKLRVLQYLYELQGISWLRLPKYDSSSSWHMMVIRVPARSRDKFLDYMLAKGISVGVHYQPLTKYKIFPQTKLPITDKVWQTLVTIPLFPDLVDEEMDQIIDAIRKFKP